MAEGEPPEVARTKIASLLSGEEAAGLAAERVAGLLGLAETAASAEERLWAVRKLLEALARRTPLVLVFDDLNWAEPTFLDLLEHVADWSRDAPILLVAMARPRADGDAARLGQRQSETRPRSSWRLCPLKIARR